jgi:predicted HAD superfamily Cof-like phosphohydrolase
LQGRIFPHTFRKRFILSFSQVQEFNDKFEVRTRVTRSAPEDLSAAVRLPEAKLRYELIREEFEELVKAYEEVDIVELADALGDIKYVVIGAAQVFGITHQVSTIAKNIEEVYEGQILNLEVQKEILGYLRIAILRNDPEGTANVLATMLKLVDDGAAHFGLDLSEIVTAIHKSNMSKLPDDGKVIRRESDNKVLKCEKNYKAPTADIERILFGETNADSE